MNENATNMLAKYMADNGIPVYEPTQDDHAYLAAREIKETVVGRLIAKIYTFDHYYDYSDSGSVYRHWSKVEKDITEELNNLDDRVLAEQLYALRSAEKRDELAVQFPWLLATASCYTYVNAILNGGDPELAKVYVGAAKWITENVLNECHKRGFAGHALWARDVAAATRAIRSGEAGEANYTGLAVPAEMYKKLGMVWRMLMASFELREELFVHYYNGDNYHCMSVDGIGFFS